MLGFLFLLLFHYSVPLMQPSLSLRSLLWVLFIVISAPTTISLDTATSYFLPGVKVHMDCELNANSPTTLERLSFSVNRTTDKFGVYKLEIPSVDGFRCAEDAAIQTLCKASLIGSSTPSCNVPGLKITAQEMAIKSKQVNLCIYCLDLLNYRPPKRDKMLCGK
ncbi:hypothetical protein NE237_021381 [Protea cynaroides]|uniref:Uncharacterized protein n=1 Tax=Protea cynaroides TaxID=273540 RepID=A0A9Q0K381_9MAGN|nr:hypothetical protein NE237_021381 [Protea cynaroides]